MSLGNNSNFTRERKVFNWSKFFTGVEKKTDGVCVYQERRSLFLYNRRKRLFTISPITYEKLKIFTVIEISIAIILFIYLKLRIAPYSITKLCFIFIFGFVLDALAVLLRTQFVKIQKTSRYEK